MEDHDLVKFVLAELITDMGGIIQLDASKLLEDARKGEFKEIGIRIEGEKLIAEVFSLNEDQATE